MLRTVNGAALRLLALYGDPEKIGGLAKKAGEIFAASGGNVEGLQRFEPVIGDKRHVAFSEEGYLLWLDCIPCCLEAVAAATEAKTIPDATAAENVDLFLKFVATLTHRNVLK